MSNQQKSKFARAAHYFCTFLCRCFVRLQQETSRNFLAAHFMEEMSYMFLFTFFSLSLIFTQVAASISYFLTAATKFHVVPPTKNVSFVFSISLQLFFSLSFAGLSFCFLFFLCLSLSLFSKFGDMTINLHLTLQTTGYKNIFRFPFLTLQLSLLRKTWVAIRFPTKIT